MQYHALALAGSGIAVDLIGYAGNLPIRAVREHPRIRLHSIHPSRLSTRDLPRVLWIAASLAERILQCARLLWMLLFRVDRPETILVQNPPAIPSLLVGVIAARMRAAKLVIDWHNFGYSMLALKLGIRHPAVRFARWYERVMGRLADRHLCVSQAMRTELAANWSIPNAKVLYDRPATQFASIPVSARESFLRRIGPSLNLPNNGSGRAALIVSPTSWSADEDISMLLEAAARCDQLIARRDSVAGKSPFTDLTIVISGQGPLRSHYENEIRGLALAKVHLRTIWLEPEDYPLLLAAADIGLCCHRSSCGLDLPMKIADLFGAGVPVLALDYGPCLKEQVRDGETGLLFKDADELAVLLYELFEQFPLAAPTLSRMRAELARIPAMSWEEGWKAEAGSIFASETLPG
ncbi:MAG TPA: glycosyltransferase [Candidatus Binataceae bacterium]|nr:glycosyltransferase [Candidatus Binataceae bacterium]